MTVAQCVAAGVDADWAARQVAAGRWQRLHRGVLVTHSGPVSWQARARAALLHAGPGAALSHRSAGFVHEIIREQPRLIEVSIPQSRRVVPSDGLRIVRRRRLETVTVSRLRVTTPGSTVVDLLDVATSTDDAVGLLCTAVRARVWPEEITEVLGGRRFHRHRSLVHELLGEVVAGVESPLELRYHRDVERRHGLPRSVRQAAQRVGGRWIRADAIYDGLGVRVELDGVLAHPGGRTDDDTWRDNSVLIERADLTLRYRWRHVRVQPCATAAQVAHALRSRGWKGHPHRCSPSCPLP